MKGKLAIWGSARYGVWYCIISAHGHKYSNNNRYYLLMNIEGNCGPGNRRVKLTSIITRKHWNNLKHGKKFNAPEVEYDQVNHAAV